jgi:vitamin B12 transporter
VTLAALVVASALLAQSAPDRPLLGTVRDATGLPLPGAVVEVDGAAVAVTDDRGEFTVAVRVRAGAHVRVSLPGFEPHDAVVPPEPGARLDVTLALRSLQDRVDVRAVRPRAETAPPLTRQPIDVYRTPGAQGDLMRALQTLPGVAAPDDSAGLFVRGGDVSEVLFTLDDGVLAHPYRYESPTGGFRGAVDPLLITGTSFATGGYSARHGNALSAVVEMRGLDLPEERDTSGTVGLAGASASIALPLHERFGVRAAVNRTFTSLLMAVNRSPRDFDPAPEGWDGSAAAGWNLGAAGRVKAFALVQRDAVGVETERDAFAGWLRASSRHEFGLVRWDGAVRSWTAAATFSSDRYARRTTAGVLDLDGADTTRAWRVDVARPGGRWADVRAGVNGALNGATVAGVTPQSGGDLGGVTGTSRFEVDARDWFAGPYVESTASAGLLSATAGLRADRYGLARAWTADPRLQLRVGGRRQALRYATGIYHQAPAASYYDRVRGAARLAPMRAVHHVAGYERGREAEGFYLRAEAYVKRYRDLPLETGDDGYSDAGIGSARGADLFAQWRSSALDLRGTASWLRARRRWTSPGERNRYPLPDGEWAPDFEIPWSMQLVAMVPFGRGVSAGASWRSAAGRPHTPIVGGRPTPFGHVPLFGPRNSERLPRYERVDLSCNWLVPVGPGTAVFFASLDNALGRANFFDYAYAADYASRRPAVTTSRRSLYVGMTYRR